MVLIFCLYFYFACGSSSLDRVWATCSTFSARVCICSDIKPFEFTCHEMCLIYTLNTILTFGLHLLSSQPRDESRHAAFKTYYMPPLDRKHGGYWGAKNTPMFDLKKKKKSHLKQDRPDMQILERTMFQQGLMLKPTQQQHVQENRQAV